MFECVCECVGVSECVRECEGERVCGMESGAGYVREQWVGKVGRPAGASCVKEKVNIFHPTDKFSPKIQNSCLHFCQCRIRRSVTRLYVVRVGGCLFEATWIISEACVLLADFLPL